MWVEHFEDKQENERERRESLANHQEKGDFFYLLDPMVRKPASVLTAIMSDLVQDLELAKKMCKTSQLGPVTSRWMSQKLILLSFIYQIVNNWRKTDYLIPYEGWTKV